VIDSPKRIKGKNINLRLSRVYLLLALQFNPKALPPERPSTSNKSCLLRFNKKVRETVSTNPPLTKLRLKRNPRRIHQ
jgi:hypothetical protein